MKTLKHILIAQILIGAAGLALAGCGTEPTAQAPDSAAGTKAYPLQTCVVSGEKLGSMGDPVVFSHEGQEVKLCCKSCRPDFDKDPARYIAKIRSQ